MTRIQITLNGTFFVFMLPKALTESSLYICCYKGVCWVEQLSAEAYATFIRRQYTMKKVKSVHCMANFVLLKEPRSVLVSEWVKNSKKKIQDIPLHQLEPADLKLQTFETFWTKLGKERRGKTIMKLLKGSNESLYKTVARGGAHDVSGMGPLSDRTLEDLYRFLRNNWEP